MLSELSKIKTINHFLYYIKIYSFFRVLLLGLESGQFFRKLLQSYRKKNGFKIDQPWTAKSRVEISTMHPGIKKIIRLPDLPKLVVSLLEKAAS